MLDQPLVALGVDEGVRDDVVRPVQLAREERVGETCLSLLAGCRAFLRGWGGGSLSGVRYVVEGRRGGDGEVWITIVIRRKVFLCRLDGWCTELYRAWARSAMGGRRCRWMNYAGQAVCIWRLRVRSSRCQAGRLAPIEVEQLFCGAVIDYLITISDLFIVTARV